MILVRELWEKSAGLEGVDAGAGDSEVDKRRSHPSSTMGNIEA